jgi:four helix bundle protein
MSGKPYDIRDRTYLFTRDSIVLGRRAVTLRDYALNRIVYQLIDAAGSVGANVEEGRDGQSKADFIHKNSVALKEVREAKFWLRQLRDAEPQRLGTAAVPLIDEAEELRLILTTIILNAKNSDSRGEAG